MNKRNETRRHGSYEESLIEEADNHTVDSSDGGLVQTLEVLFEPGAVVEVRAFGGGRRLAATSMTTQSLPTRPAS